MTKKQEIDAILTQKQAELTYRGKSKDVYTLPNGNVLMVFKDTFTGTNGVEDPGANENAGEREGLGHKNLEVSSYIFKEIEKNIKVPTQNVAADLKLDILEAKKAKPFGSGLEFISRNRAWGSYLKRFKEAKEGDNLMQEDGFAFVEVSIKDDALGDPIYTKEEHVSHGIITASEFDQGVKYTKLITQFLTTLFKTKGLELIDMKMEFGSDGNGGVMLIDEISPGSLRALTLDGKKASKELVHEMLMK